MKKEILVYETDKDVLKFLRSFFKGRADYSTRFIKRDKGALKKEVTKRMPAALIVSSPDGLEHIKPSEIKCPLIALIASGNVTNGIRFVVKFDVEYYLLSPFYKEDFEHRLKVAIERKSWFENLYKKEKDIEVLIEFTYLISSTLNPKKALYLVVKKISEMINVTRCSIISTDVEEGSLYVVSTFEDPEITNIRLDLKKYPEIKKAISLKRPVVIKDALKDPIMREVKDIIAQIGIRSIVVVPIIFRDEDIGTLLLRTARADYTFTKREIRLCIAIANASANALYNAFLYDRLAKDKTMFERLALTDYLTGIYNIRYFYSRLEEEFSRSKRYNMPLSCIMLDIDHFKKVNDNYGHRMGDIVLREFAQLVRGCTRKSDIFARYGGEEFIILLPQTTLKGAIDKAKLIRRAVKEYQFMGIEKEHMVTVSMGIACGHDEGIKTYDDLITFADNALFTAKNKGRDQIVVYPSL